MPYHDAMHRCHTTMHLSDLVVPTTMPYHDASQWPRGQQLSSLIWFLTRSETGCPSSWLCGEFSRQQQGPAEVGWRDFNISVQGEGFSRGWISRETPPTPHCHEKLVGIDSWRDGRCWLVNDENEPYCSWSLLMLISSLEYSHGDQSLNQISVKWIFRELCTTQLHN